MKSSQCVDVNEVNSSEVKLSEVRSSQAKE